jgi:hypothetical protein
MVLRALTLIGPMALAACAANEDIPVPGIIGIAPDHGVPGAIVTVAGQYLCQEPRSDENRDPPLCRHLGTVMFGAAPATATSYGDTMVVVEVPAVARGRLDVIVSVAGKSSNRVPFVID